MPTPPRDLTFISYSHEDKPWLDKLVKTLAPLVRAGSVKYWTDIKIESGSQWQQEIESALKTARVAVLLVSRDYLASDFIANHELPILLKKAKGGGLTIVWVPLSASSYDATDLKNYQAAHEVSKPLDSLSEPEQAKALVEIARKIRDAARTRRGDSEGSVSRDESQEAIKGLRPFRHEDAEIFARLGRQSEVDLCAGAIADSEFRFGIVSGESGCGKSSFLQAGLWPKLETYRVPHRCVYVKFANEDPIETIKRALSDTLGIPTADPDNSDLRTLFKTAMQISPTPLVLLFDQFEQFFVHKKYKHDRQPFVQAMAAWYLERKTLPVKIVVSIRGDFSDRLIELQTAMGYSIGPGQNFRLEKFEPTEAANVIKEIAEVEGLPVEEHFVESMVNELAGRDDGLISPAYLQIMAWVIKRQKAADKRGFTSKAFQKIGGIEGLLERFLTDTLAARHGDSAKQTALKVLVALIDLDRSARAGLMTVGALQNRLKGSLNNEEVSEAVEWLVSPNVRLITQQEQKDQVAYELAHECLIPPVRKLAGKQLSEADRANQVLDRRVNEWLGNDRKSSYLFGWRDWRLVERNRPYIIWGPQRSQKEELLLRTKRKRMRHAGAIGGVLVLMVGAVAAWFSPWGQIQMVERDIAKLISRGIDQKTLIVISQGLASLRDFDQAGEVAHRIGEPREKAEALGALARAAAEAGDPNQATALLKQAAEAAARIDRRFAKARALGAVAQATAQVASATKNTEKNTELLKQVAEAAARIDDPVEKARALGAIAEATAQVASVTKNTELLKQAAEAAARIDDPFAKARALGAVARATAQVGDASKAAELLKQAAEAAARIDRPFAKAQALRAVARAMAQAANATKNTELLKQAGEAAARIDEPFAKAQALGAVARAAAQLGHWQQARDYAELTTTNEGKVKALIGILQVWHGTDEKFAEKKSAADDSEF